MKKITIKLWNKTSFQDVDNCPTCNCDADLRNEEKHEDEDGVTVLVCKDEWHLEEIEHELPGCWAICSRCRGNGTHVNPNVDGHGISMEEWHNEWDEDEREMYMSGGYDVACEAGCDSGKQWVVDVGRLSDAQKTIYAQWEKQEADRAAEDYADRRTRWAENGYPRDGY